MRLILDGIQKDIVHTGSVEKLLKSLKIRREEVIVKVNGKTTPETIDLSTNDEVEIIRVVFGG
jgi:sulfur carrier protein ThiS